MIYLMMADENYMEVRDASTATVEGGQVVCRSSEGNIVAMIAASTVSAYGSHRVLAELATARVEVEPER